MIAFLNSLIILIGYAAHVPLWGVGGFLFIKHPRRPPLSLTLLTVLIIINSVRPNANQVFVWIWLGTLGAYLVGASYLAWARNAVINLSKLSIIAMLTEGVLTLGRSFIGTPGASSSVLLLALPLLSGWWAWAAWVAVVFAQSRAAWLGALTVKLGKRGAWVIGVLVGAAFCFAIIRPETVMIRLVEWGEAVGYITASPLWGYGMGAWAWLGQTQTQGLARVIHNDNALLTVWVEMGAVGVALTLWLLRDVWQSIKQHPQAWGIAAWAVMQLAEHTLYSPWVGIVLGLTVGLLQAEEKLRRASQPELFAWRLGWRWVLAFE